MIQTSETVSRDTRFAPVYQVLEEAIASHAFPGCAFGLLAEGETTHLGAVGRFTYEEDAPLVQAETVFDLASVSKVVGTTAMAMLLVQRGQLDPEIPVGELLPGFVVGRGYGSLAHHIKLRHLLAHNSGLPGYVEFFRQNRTPAELYRACLNLALEAEPGARCEYSDPGFILLGKALEVLTKERLEVWTKREIFAPLGMTSTFYNPPASRREAIPPTEEDISFRRRRIQGEVQDENAWVLGGAAGHAGLFSNVRDLLKFSAAVLGEKSAPALFEESTVEAFSVRQSPAGSSRALGWDTPSPESSAGKYFSARSLGHLGYSGCSLWIDREARIAAVLLSNRTWPERKSQLIKQIRPAFHNAIRQVL